MPKHFTLDEATRLLPLLRELVPEAQERKRRVDALRNDVALLAMKAAGDGHLVQEQMQTKRSALEEAVRALDASLERITSLGCEVKGIDQGLIDFPSLREGREVYLCWRLGEEQISYWHELHGGLAGRQPL